MVIASHKRRIKTEKKATVVANVWGTELVRFLAVLAILHQDDWKKDMNSSHRVMNNIESKATPPPSPQPSLSLNSGTFVQHQSPCRQYWELQAVYITAL